MASPVKDAKNKIQAQRPGASVHSRGKGWHFGDGPFMELINPFEMITRVE